MSRDWWWQRIKTEDYELWRIKADFERGLEECKPRLTENEVGWLIKQIEAEKERADKAEAREEELKEAIDFVMINELLYHATDAHEHFQEIVESLYPKEGEAK